MATATMFPLLRSLQRTQAERAQDLVTRYNALKQQRMLYDFDYQDIVRYLVPGADDVMELHEPGQSRTQYVFDSHPLRAPQILAANMMGTVTNQSMEWRRLKFRDEALNESQDVSAWLKACDKRIMAAYASSNFYQACHTFYMNLGGFGTAAMYSGLMDTHFGKSLHFKTLPTGSYVIAENAFGIVDTLIKELWLTPRQAIQRFRGNVSDTMRQMADKPGTMDTPKKFLYGVCPRTDRDHQSYDKTNMPFESLCVEFDSKYCNEEDGFHEFPYLVARWDTLNKSPYGFGPGHLSLPDVRMLNNLRELNLQQLTLWVQPAFKVLREGVLGNISLESLALNVVTQMDALQPLDTTGRPDLVQLDQADLRRSIEDAFYVNALQALPPPDAANMTAYEVSQRIDIMTRTMGPVFYRLLAEFLTPNEDRTFGTMWREDAFPDPPFEVLQAAGRNQGQLDVEYSGPLARSQRGEEIRSLQDYMRLTATAVQTQQNLEAVDLFDWDGALRDAAEVLGVQAFRKDFADVLRMREARARQQQQMQQAQMENERMAAIGRVAPVMGQVSQGQMTQQAA